jgi:hypothetical protein
VIVAALSKRLAYEGKKMGLALGKRGHGFDPLQSRNEDFEFLAQPLRSWRRFPSALPMKGKRWASRLESAATV